MLTDFYVLDTKDNSLKKECFQTQHTEELVSQILECKGEKEYIYRSSLFGFSYFADLVSNKKDIYAKQRKNAVLDTFARNDGSAGKGIERVTIPENGDWVDAYDMYGGQGLLVDFDAYKKKLYQMGLR